MEVYTENAATEQVHETEQADIPLTPKDRRFLLGASLRLLVHRFSHGKPILGDDLERIAVFADDAGERAA